MKTTNIGLVILCVAAVAGFTVPARSTPGPQPSLLQDKPDKAQSLKGKVEAVDTTANTMTVDGKVIYIAANTKITKSGKTVTLSEVQTGDEVSGTTHQTFDGKTEADAVMVSSKEKK